MKLFNIFLSFLSVHVAAVLRHYSFVLLYRKEAALQIMAMQASPRLLPSLWLHLDEYSLVLDFL